MFRSAFAVFKISFPVLLGAGILFGIARPESAFALEYGEQLIYDSIEDQEELASDGGVPEEELEEWREAEAEPLDVNRAGEQELSALPGMEPEDAGRIVRERFRSGPYTSVRDLVRRRVLDEEQYESLKDRLVCEKTSAGDVSLESFSGGRVYEPVRGSLRVRMRIPGRDVLWGGTFLRAPFYGMEANREGPHPLAVSKQDVRWIKSYAAWDRRHRDGAGRAPWLKQVYFGHYRVGFHEGLYREKSSGFLPDDRAFLPSEVGIFSSRRQPVPLKGAALGVGAGLFRWNAFYSRDDYPAVVSAAVPPSTAERFVSVQNQAGIGVAGTHASVRCAPALEISVFGTAFRSRLGEASGRYRTDENRAWGLQYKGVFQGLSLRAVFSRLNEPARGWDARAGRNFYLAGFNAAVSEYAVFSGSYKNVEPGFIHPVGNTFSGASAKQYSFQLRQRWSRSLTSRWSFRQKQDDSFLFRQADGFGWWQARETSALFVALTVRDYRFEERSSAGDRVSDAGSLLAGVHYRGPDSFQTRFYVQTQKYRASGGFADRISQTLGCRTAAVFARNWVLKGDLRFLDADIGRPNNEAQIARLELSKVLFSRLRLTVSWQSRYYVRNRVVGLNGLYQQIEMPGSQNTAAVKARYRW